MRKIVALTLALMLILSMTACDAAAPETAPAEANTAGEQSAEQTNDETGLPGAGKKVGFAQVHYSNAHRINQTQNVIDSCEALGFEVVWNEANRDTATQISNCNDLIAQGISYLIIAPNESEGLVSALESAKKAGVPVVLIDRMVNAQVGEDYLTFVTPDFVWAGAECGRWIKENYPDGANICVVAGTAVSSASIDHLNGFHSEIDGVEGMNILSEQNTDYSRAQAQTTTENLMQAHGSDVDIIFTESDELAFGVMQGLRTAGYEPGKDVVVITCGDGSIDMVKEVAEGTVALCVENTPNLGTGAAKAIEMHMNGEEIPESIIVDNRVFTKELAQQALDEGTAWG